MVIFNILQSITSVLCQLEAPEKGRAKRAVKEEKRKEEFKSSLSSKSKVASRGGEEGLSERVSRSSR